MQTLVVIPTYNEVQNVPLIGEALLALALPGLSVLVVDDNSPDGTGAAAEALARRFAGRVHVLHRSGRSGLGRAYVDGFRWALEREADTILQMDADFSHAPRYVPCLLEKSAAYDVVIGSRYVRGGRVDERWGLGRRWLSTGANLYARAVLGLRTRDATAGFKCWRRAALAAINVERIASDGYVFQVEMTYAAERLGLCMLEVPIYFEDRRIGASKLSFGNKLEAVWRVAQMRQRPRPEARANHKRGEHECSHIR
jgi:dolichol-phosphate mannosyltransferase